MKLIHCADLHLDAGLQTHLDRERAKLRRDELLRNFRRLVDYAENNGVEAILIAGDLFDRDPVSALARNTVLAEIGTHPGIRFYYLRGNHDRGDCLRAGAGQGCAAENLFLFDRRWKTYPEGKSGNIVIAGIELTRGNSAAAQTSLRLDPGRLNIVMLHGQVSGGGEGASGFAEEIRLRDLRGRGIDYLALGHLHSYQEFPLDSRGVCCYPGCLEGRGFDECGPHGFVLLEIDESRRTMTRRFVPFARRTLYAVEADITGCRTTAEIRARVAEVLRAAGCSGRDMADVTLCGELDVESEMDPGYLRAELEEELFFARLRDRTTLSVDPEDYLHDESLRGEFVRLVMADPSVPEEEKAAVIRCGFQAMDGELSV